MNQYYEEALKAGQKKYRQCLSKGEYPYLPVLDEMVPAVQTAAGIDLGIVQVPIELIAGTKTAGRTTVFAANFMPLAEEQTEFSEKWKRLCESHLEEGIRDPIECFEYRNRYYVQEGNKRVSVMKFFNAVSIPAHVRRILPVTTEDVNLDKYYELIDFIKYSRVYFIEFSRKESYGRLLELMKKKPHEQWDDDDSKRLRSVYYRFRKIFLENGGDRLRSTPADALLICLIIYGFDTFHGLSQDEMKKAVQKIWKEIVLDQEEKQIDIKTDPEESPQKLIPRLLGVRKQTIGFLYRGSSEQLGWSNYHEMGRLHVQEVFGDKIETFCSEFVTEENVDDKIDEMAEKGAGIIFATSAEFYDGCLRKAVEYPQIRFLNCSLNKPHRLVRTYFPRMYEAKFVTGALAGVLTQTDEIGYVCKYPIYGSIAEINAFARGVKMTNPWAEIHLEWSSLCGGTVEAVNKLEKEGVHLISVGEFARHEDDVNGKSRKFYGLDYVQDGESVQLALPLWNWGIYYERIIRAVMNGTFEDEEHKSEKSLNYYWGMSSGVVDLVYSAKLPRSVRYLGETLRRSIRENLCNPFYNYELYEGKENNLITDDQPLDMEEVINMDWLEENVIGRIPKFSELDEQVQDMVNQVGVASARKQAEDSGEL